MKWTETSHCRSKAHCRICRDPGDAGKAFRHRLSLVFQVEPGLFECPFNENPGPLPADPQYVTDRLTVCSACDDNACGVKVKTACERKAYCRLPGACCPANPPKWTPQ